MPCAAVAREWAGDHPLFDVLRGGEVEEDRDKLGVRDPLAVGGRVIDADGHPQCRAVGEVLLGGMCLDITSRIISAHN